MKKTAILVTLIALLLLTACGKSASNDTGSSAGEGKLEKIQLLLAAEGNATYYTYVATRQGVFCRRGS